MSKQIVKPSSSKTVADQLNVRKTTAPLFRAFLKHSAVALIAASLGVFTILSEPASVDARGANSILLVSNAVPLVPLHAIPGSGNRLPAQKRNEAAPLGDNDTWVPVPDWLAGTWSAKSQIILYSYDHAQKRYAVSQATKIPVNRERTIGVQRDQKGQIWHLIETPYLRIIETPNYIERQKIERVELLAQTENTLTLKSVATVTHLEKKTFEVLDAFTEETFTTYEPIGDGLTQLTFNINDYDSLGRPKYTSKSICTETRIKAFEPIDQDNRTDLRQLFLDFLRQHKLMNR